MKKSFPYVLIITLIMTLAAATQSLGVTFEQYDRMPEKQQAQFVKERARTIYYWLEKNDPDVAACMIEKINFDPKTGYSQALTDIQKKIDDVPQDKRGESKVEDLMMGFITTDLCGDGPTQVAAGGAEPRQAQETNQQIQLTTFTEWDQMTTEQQGDWVEDRTRFIYYKLANTDPAKADCMEEKFIGEVGETPEGFKEFVRKVKGVPDDKRANNYVENLMAGYIIEELCGGVTSKAPVNDKPAMK